MLLAAADAYRMPNLAEACEAGVVQLLQDDHAAVRVGGARAKSRTVRLFALFCYILALFISFWYLFLLFMTFLTHF